MGMDEEEEKKEEERGQRVEWIKMERLKPAMGSELRQIPPCRAAGRDSLSLAG